MSPVINARGDAAFIAHTAKSVIIDEPPFPPFEAAGSPFLSGVLREKNGVAELVAVEGRSPAGAGANESFARFDELVVNGLGQVAFIASLILPGQENTSEISNYDSLWATDVAGELHLIGRVGSQLSAEYLGTSFSKTIASMSFTGGSGNEDGLPSGFNERGQVAFYATFTDGMPGCLCRMSSRCRNRACACFGGRFFSWLIARRGETIHGKANKLSAPCG